GREIAEELRATAPDRHVDMVIGEGIIGWGDARLLRVALQNLLDNAWKFTAHEPNARIELGVLNRESEQPTFFVRDNGIGFDMDFQDRLFRPFQRLHTGDDFPGTGVGLALVQRIIIRHGGRIWAESSVGRGASFFFTLRGPPEEATPT